MQIYNPHVCQNYAFCDGTIVDDINSQTDQVAFKINSLFFASLFIKIILCQLDQICHNCLIHDPHIL